MVFAGYRVNGDGFFCNLVRGKIGDDPAFAHYQHPVRQAHDFGHFRGHDEDRVAFGRELFDQGVDFGFGTNVDAARGFVKEEYVGTGGEPSADDRLLLCLLYTSPSPRDQRGSRMPSSA